MDVPQTRYARSGDLNIAYQVFGAGSIDPVYVPGWVSHVEEAWESPDYAAFLRRLGSFAFQGESGWLQRGKRGELTAQLTSRAAAVELLAGRGSALAEFFGEPVGCDAQCCAAEAAEHSEASSHQQEDKEMGR